MLLPLNGGQLHCKFVYFSLACALGLSGNVLNDNFMPYGTHPHTRLLIKKIRDMNIMIHVSVSVFYMSVVDFF